jgi:hypothetical protein
MNPAPPKDWIGDVDEQRELWVQIFTYHTFMQHYCPTMTYFDFCLKLPAFKTTYKDKTLEQLKLLLEMWQTPYKAESNIEGILDGQHLSKILYSTQLQNSLPEPYYVNRYKHIYCYLKE